PQLTIASQLTGHTETEIKSQPAANLDAGAALLAAGHQAGTSLDSWRQAVVATQGTYVAAQVYAVLRSGAHRTTSTGEAITLDPQPVTVTSTSPKVGGAASINIATATPDYAGA